jgi:hypothetical protein
MSNPVVRIDAKDVRISVKAEPVPGDNRAFDVTVSQSGSEQKQFRVLAMRTTTRDSAATDVPVKRVPA